MIRRAAATAAGIAALLAAGCEPAAAPTTERIIRIQIEGCEDAAPLPATPAIAAVQATPQAGPDRTAVAAPSRAPTRAPAAQSATANEVAVRRDGFTALLRDEHLHALDVPSAWESFRRAEEAERAKDYDEALRLIEVAILDARRVKVDERFLQKKFERVEKRIEEIRGSLSRRDQAIVSRRMAQAHQHFLSNAFRSTNRDLYEVELAIEQRRAGVRRPGRGGRNPP